MVNKNFIQNPHYYTSTHRTLSEATRDVQYASSIYAYEEDHGSVPTAIILGGLFIGFVLFAIYFDQILEHFK
jgi:hypothetical protein